MTYSLSTTVYLCIMSFILGLGFMGLILTIVNNYIEKKKEKNSKLPYCAGDILELYIEDPFKKSPKIMIIECQRSRLPSSNELWYRYCYLNDDYEFQVKNPTTYSASESQLKVYTKTDHRDLTKEELEEVSKN